MITVVLSVYNTGKYLARAINSLLKQTYTDFEIIIVDDGSTDGSSEICEVQAQRSEIIRVFHKENGGLSSARNFGIEHANGDYIIFPDPDDWVNANYLEKLVTDMQNSGADLAICGYYRTWGKRDEKANPKGKKALLNTYDAIKLLVSPLAFQGYAWNKLYNTKVIRENNLRFDEELKAVQDLHFAVRYFFFCKTVYYDPQPLYHYCRDTGGVTTFKTIGERELSGIRTYEKIGALTHKVHPDAEKEVYASLCWWTLILIRVYFYKKMNDPKLLKMLRKKFKKHLYYYLISYRFTFRGKVGSSVAAFSPKLYYFLYCNFSNTKKKKKMKDTCTNKCKSK